MNDTNRSGRVPDEITSRQKCEANRRKVYTLAGLPSSRIGTAHTAGLATTHESATSR